MHLSQIETPGGNRRVVFRDGGIARTVNDVESSYELAQAAIQAGKTIAQMIAEYGLGKEVDLGAALSEGRVLAPISHADPAHLHLTGTGLTHLGSAATRDAMHQGGEAALSDSMKMFRMGIDGGKPAALPGVQPEWFYKGNGTQIAAPEAALVSPDFALDSGEEPEIAGIYLIGADARPCRLGFALANEFSDHVTERQNYLYLAHSKLRPASFGPEILLGALPGNIEGTSRIRRGGRVVWQKPFLSGEDNMSHWIANLEHHHFKYGLFRQPGDVHVHMFGTATLSFADGVRAEPGDTFEIEAPDFGMPLRNTLAIAQPETVAIRQL